MQESSINHQWIVNNPLLAEFGGGNKPKLIGKWSHSLQPSTATLSATSSSVLEGWLNLATTLWPSAPSSSDLKILSCHSPKQVSNYCGSSEQFVFLNACFPHMSAHDFIGWGAVSEAWAWPLNFIHWIEKLMIISDKPNITGQDPNPASASADFLERMAGARFKMTWAQSVPREAHPHHCRYIWSFDVVVLSLLLNCVYMCAWFCMSTCVFCLHGYRTCMHAACPCTWRFCMCDYLSYSCLMFLANICTMPTYTQAYQSQPQGVQVSHCRMSIGICRLPLRMPYFSVWVRKFALSTSVRKGFGAGKRLHLLPAPLTMVAKKPRSRSHLCQPVLIEGGTLVYLVSFWESVRKLRGEY